jgi:hypothetical protein
MKSIMTKADLLKMLEPLSDTDVIQCQVNYTTSKTEAAYSQYKHTTEVVPITGMTVQEIPNGPNRNHKVYQNDYKTAYLQVNVEID